MGKSRLIQAVALIALAALFVWGLVMLATMRFEQGDSYAPYSSLRSDPLGCRGLYGAIGKLPGHRVRRHLQSLRSLDGGPGQLVVLLGLQAGELADHDTELQQQLLRLAASGSRVLIAARPPDEARLRAAQKKKTAETDTDTTDGDVATQDGAADGDEAEKVSDWGLRIDWLPASEPPRYPGQRLQANAELPGELLSHSPLVLHADSDAWQPVFGSPQGMIVAQRCWGEGSLLVFVDSYPFSNEALRNQPQPALMAWALGPVREVVFVESHLGVNVTPGLMTLIRRYRLDGILLALFVIAALAVWKNALPLVPPPPPVAGGVATRDHFSGLVNLLERHIPMADLGEACHREWRRGLSRYGYPSEEKRRRIDELIQTERQRPAQERRPLSLYRKICQILAERMM